MSRRRSGWTHWVQYLLGRVAEKPDPRTECWIDTQLLDGRLLSVHNFFEAVEQPAASSQQQPAAQRHRPGGLDTDTDSGWRGPRLDVKRRSNASRYDKELPTASSRGRATYMSLQRLWYTYTT